MSSCEGDLKVDETGGVLDSFHNFDRFKVKLFVEKLIP